MCHHSPYGWVVISYPRRSQKASRRIIYTDENTQSPEQSVGFCV